MQNNAQMVKRRWKILAGVGVIWIAMEAVAVLVVLLVLLINASSG